MDELELKDWKRAVDAARETELNARHMLRYLYSQRMTRREARLALEGDFVSAFANIFEVSQTDVRKALGMMCDLLRCPRCGKLADWDEFEIREWGLPEPGAEGKEESG